MLVCCLYNHSQDWTNTVTMPFLKRQADQVEGTPQEGIKTDNEPSPATAGSSVTFKAVFLGIVVSIGGFMFGYVR